LCAAVSLWSKSLCSMAGRRMEGEVWFWWNWCSSRSSWLDSHRQSWWLGR
jgi:hypothetical protein